MKVTNLKDLSKEDYQRIIKRSYGKNEIIAPEVKRIIETIRNEGESVILKKYQKRFGEENFNSVVVSDEEIKVAYRSIDEDFRKAIKQMIRNITLVHKDQLTEKTEKMIFPEKGISVWRVWRAIERVGLYIPGGKAIYPSSVLMSAIPAKLAGCNEIVICSPPGQDGKIPNPTLVAADMVGVNKIFKVGGAEAIAAMAYGTKNIPKVYKIFGAGNAYVTEAKMLVFGETAIDMPAGPSEIFIIADDTANPSYIAADLLADGEHGDDSACVLLTTSERIAQKTIREIEKQIRRLSTAGRINKSLKRYGLFAVSESMEEIISFVNDYAPEHLEIMTGFPEKVAKRIENAGSVFLGNWTTKSSGDYATGANHVLPTGGMAKMYPPLGVDAFGKWMQVQKCTKEGLSKIRKTIEIMAETERLPAHKNATRIRFINI